MSRPRIWYVFYLYTRMKQRKKIRVALTTLFLHECNVKTSHMICILFIYMYETKKKKLARAHLSHSISVPLCCCFLKWSTTLIDGLNSSIQMTSIRWNHPRRQSVVEGSPEIFSRPFRLFPTPTNCPWVSEDDTEICYIIYLCTLLKMLLLSSRLEWNGGKIGHQCEPRRVFGRKSCRDYFWCAGLLT